MKEVINLMGKRIEVSVIDVHPADGALTGHFVFSRAFGRENAFLKFSPAGEFISYETTSPVMGRLMRAVNPPTPIQMEFFKKCIELAMKQAV